MIDIHTHRIIDMINSREHNEVVTWLKTYPNLKLVSRDGSITYKNAIYEAHPFAVQVSDRFHLLKNITEYAANYLKKKLNLVVKVCTPQNISSSSYEVTLVEYNNQLTLSEKYDKVIKLLAKGEDQTQICKSLNLDVRTYKKLVNSTEDERNRKFISLQKQRRQEKIESRTNTANELHKYIEQGLSQREISKLTVLSRNTIKRYLAPDFTPVHALAGKKRVGKLSPYEDAINTLLEKGTSGVEIEKMIREQGYTGSSSLVRTYITEWKKKYKKFSVT